MRCTPSEIRRDSISATAAQLVSIVVIAYAFLLPVPGYFAILFALFVSLIMALWTHLQISMALNKNRALESLWLNELTMRMAIDEISNEFHTGRPVGVDWQKITKAAVADIKQCNSDMKLADEFSNGLMIDLIFYGLAEILPIVLRIALGMAAAHIATVYLPNFVAAILPS